MQRVLSTYMFIHRKLTPALLAEIARASIPAVELFCERPHFDYRELQEVRELAGRFSEERLTVHSLHAPTDRDLVPGRESGVPISLCDLERIRRLDAVDEVKRALEVAEFIPFRYLVQHLGTARDSPDPRRWDAAFSSLEPLEVFAKQRGVTIALENTPGELATPENLRHFIEETHLNDLRLCFDTGHAHMEGGVENSFQVMGELVVTTHVHDNHGERDEHLLPYEGNINWDATLKAMAGAVLNGLPIALELKEQALPALAQASVTSALRAAQGVFDRFEQALASQSPGPSGARTLPG
ncbi:MAG TPA: sugar phosphate isomerase/epimerase family protein [Candidatus Acidoferrales bacterium]|nr:sugar phosphate isomerase/epimerase family protein [Candidatus Acidoferrales bacterium]